MQAPTCTGIRIRSPADAHVIFHAVSLQRLPMVTRRLDTDERRFIQSGCVFVWEERGSNTENTGIGIERWTDSIRWGPSRVKDEFLYYQERETTPADKDSDTCATSPLRSLRARGSNQGNLIKQTYSVFVDTPRGRRKWHLIAYFTQETLGYLQTVDHIPKLASINVPPGKYRTARTGTRRTQSSFEVVVGYTEDIQPYGTRHATSGCSTLCHITSAPSSNSSTGLLAPLEYLRFLPQPRRHPLDEKALMSFRQQAPSII